MLSIQTTLPGAYWVSATASPWLGCVLELGPERRRVVPVEDVEGHDVGRERVPGQHALVEQPVQQVRLAPARARLLGPVLGRSLGLDLLRLGRRVALGGLGQAAVGVEVEGLVDVPQRLGDDAVKEPRRGPRAASSVGQPGGDLAAKLVLRSAFSQSSRSARFSGDVVPVNSSTVPRTSKSCGWSSGSMSGRRSWW